MAGLKFRFRDYHAVSSLYSFDFDKSIDLFESWLLNLYKRNNSITNLLTSWERFTNQRVNILSYCAYLLTNSSSVAKQVINYSLQVTEREIFFWSRNVNISILLSLPFIFSTKQRHKIRKDRIRNVLPYSVQWQTGGFTIICAQESSCSLLLALK